jgi:propanol-preferring alcohol dehydrogenase
MKAAILEKGQVTIQDIPKPSPGPEEAVVRITSAGVCHSDVHLVKGDWPQLNPPFPIPMGHEGIGIVEELGPGADKFIKEGARVILGLGGTGGGYWCGGWSRSLRSTDRQGIWI